MNIQPPYFEPIRLKSARRWEQLEQDPELAAPWHQLFKQVQSPRHVLSELLQNADDAGATEATVRIEDQVFIFEHNGEDFAEEHFASLCRFGYSNKRALHTIGFRGIGFKSTFSLGDCVELFTPTLAVSFDRKRFTEPQWQSHQHQTNGRTCIRVAIQDQHRQKDIEKNLTEWIKSSLSLLFFKNIRRLQVGEHAMQWDSLGPGPVANSKWMSLAGQKSERFLLLRSEPETFPEEALVELKQERMLVAEQDMDFPPCTIEIVLGAEGRLFVVLPTGIKTKLPFACNAPFIQDPARLKIKDPETSPTNRWLLARAGQLAASAMLNWLGHSELSTVERASAYGLFPDVDRKDSSLEGGCGTIVEIAFAEAIVDQQLLLTDDGKLSLKKESIIIPPEMFDIWPVEQAAILLDDQGRHPLCRYIDPADQKKLLHWDIIKQIDKRQILGILQNKHLPKPETWQQLLNLWVYIAQEISTLSSTVSANNLRIVPVQGKDVLYAAIEVVRLGERKLLQSDEDWEFLSAYLLVLNQNWPRFLAEQRRDAGEQKDETVQKAVNTAYTILEKINLNDTSDTNKVIDRFASKFFSLQGISLQKCIQLAQIAAKLGATAGNSFRYVTSDNHIRPTTSGILFDQDGTLADLIPTQSQKSQLLHPDYTAHFSACSQEEWVKWISSGRAGLLTFIPFIQSRTTIYGRKKIEGEARKRGLKTNLIYAYVTDRFICEDWDYAPIYWQHWMAMAATDERVWAKIVECILQQRNEYWDRSKSAQLLQVATTSAERSVTYDALMPSWALRLRDVACLSDTRGFRWKPGDLLRRTPETESLMDVEPFIHGRLDNEAARPLLDLLGVRSIPTGPDNLLERLRALAKAVTPPVHEVDKWYRRFDLMVDTCSTTDFKKIQQAFRSEKLVLTHDGGWATANAVFIAADEEDVPGIAVIRSSVRDLTFWRKIGVADRATAELAIQWIKNLPSGVVLASDDVRRVRGLLERYPIRIWAECEHWLNLAGEWVPTTGLHYTITMQSLVMWRHLHQWVKQKTADLQRFPKEVTGNPPFSALHPLAQNLEERLQQDIQPIGCAVKEEWLTTIGTELQRVELENEPDTHRSRIIAERLAKTEWQTTQVLEVIPYLEGIPAGTARQVDVLWSDLVLYVSQLPKAKLAKRVPEEIGKAFGRDDLKTALDYSFERSSEKIREYLEINFKLAPHISVLEMPIGKVDPDALKTPVILSPTPDTDAPGSVMIIDGDNESPGEIIMGARTDEIRPQQPNDDEQESKLDHVQPIVRPILEPKPSKPPLIERFAQAHGFYKDGSDRFYRKDGSWIGRTSGSAFPWEHRTSTGDLIRYYWLEDHCLERIPLQLKAEIWGMLDRFPETYALIILNIDEEPIEQTGARLRALCDERKISLYPATYRLVYSHDDHA